MKYTYLQDIAAPIERVFDWLHDPQKHKQWLQGVEETRYVGEYDPAHPQGARFKQWIREGRRVKEYDGEVTTFTRPSHLGIRLFSPQFSIQVDYRLTASGAGTHLDYLADVNCHSWFARLMVGLFSFMMRGMMKKQMTKLKELAEGEALAK
jgi:carbon monoxide dehydrogenase subunit G